MGTAAENPNDPDQQPFRWHNPGGQAPVLILCDHASPAVPTAYAGLGLPPDQFTRHIAYDIGAADVVEGLADLLDAPAVLAGFSRLLIDANRGEDDPTLIMLLSDGAVIPANRSVCAVEREKRLARYYRPYHDAITAKLADFKARNIVPLILSIHSFTPAWKGKERPWHAGILWDKDPRVAHRLLAALREDPALIVGDNQPYSGELENDTMYRHASMAGLPHGLIEIRQDLIASAKGQQAWASRLARIIQPMVSDSLLRQPAFFSARP